MSKKQRVMFYPSDFSHHINPIKNIASEIPEPLSTVRNIDNVVKS